MTLLVARQCRLLRAPHAAPGALRRLQRPAIARAARSYADEATAHAPSFTLKKYVVSPGPEPAAAVHAEARADAPSFTIRKHASADGPLDQHYARHNATTNHAKRELNSQLLTPRLEDSEITPVHSAILVPASVAAAKPDHFVDKIEPLHASAIPGHPFVVFLATPSFAPWLLDDRVFLEKALGKLYKNLSGPAPEVHAVCAVVDKLPQPRSTRGEEGPDAMRLEIRGRTNSPPVNETGVEGIAYVVLPHQARMPAQPTISGEHGCIDFIAHTFTSKDGRHHDRVRVPLANTVFQTGVPTTLISSSWLPSGRGHKLEVVSRKHLKTLAINLSAQPLGPGTQTRSPRYQETSALSIPLLPLTLPRQVDGHMGNIIRGLIGPDGNKMTASTELEQVVPRYFKTRDESAQATSAWALVIPKDKAHSFVNKDVQELLFKEIDSDLRTLKESSDQEDRQRFEQQALDSLWRGDPPRWNKLIQHTFGRGGRLHKVLSGGGGWGKKAGLLSLDPMPVGAPRREPISKKNEEDFDSVDEFSTALKPVVQDGDFIQFFISPAVAQKPDVFAFLDSERSEGSAEKKVWSWEFGVIPSTIDSIPGGSSQHTGEASEEMTVFEGTFGALTEGGLTLMRGRGIDERTGIAEKDFNATTIDVPFSRWSAIRLLPKAGTKLKTVGDYKIYSQKSRKQFPSKGRFDSVRDFSTSTLANPYTRPTIQWSVDTTQGRRSIRTFSTTTRSFGAQNIYKSHLRRSRKRQMKRNEEISSSADGDEGSHAAYQPTPRSAPVNADLTSSGAPASKRPPIRKITKDFDPQRDAERLQQKPREQHVPRETASTSPLRVRRMISQNLASSTSTSPSHPSAAPSPNPDSTQDNIKGSKSNRNYLPRLLRQIQDPVSVPPRVPHERAQGEDKRDFEKLVNYLWREYYRVKSAVRRVEAGLPVKKEKRKKKELRKKELGERKEPAVRRVKSEVVTSFDVAEMCKESMKLSGRHLMMLTEQIRLVTGLKGSELQGWRAWKRKNEVERLEQRGGRKRSVVRTVRLEPNSPTSPSGRRRGRAVHRKPSGLDFVMRSIPISPASAPQSQRSQKPEFQVQLSHFYSNLRRITKRIRILSTDLSIHLQDPAIRTHPPRAPKPSPALPLSRRARLSSRIHATHTLGVLHGQATRVIKRVHFLSAQVRALLPTAPVPISTHASRIQPRSEASRRPTQVSAQISPSPTASEPQTRTQRRTARHILHLLRNQRIANRPLSGKARYGDRQVFASVRGKTRPRLRYDASGNRLERARARRVLEGGWKRVSKHLVGKRPRVRKMTKRSEKERLADNVGEWLMGGGGGGLFT